jgi:hypothetical protein
MAWIAMVGQRELRYTRSRVVVKCYEALRGMPKIMSVCPDIETLKDVIARARSEAISHPTGRGTKEEIASSFHSSQ